MLSEALIKQIKDLERRVHEKDPLDGTWKIPIGDECIAYCNGSSLGVGAELLKIELLKTYIG